MNRREFVQTAAGGLAIGLERDGFSRAAAQNPAPSTRALMKVGTQHGDSDAILRVLAGFGVNHIFFDVIRWFGTRKKIFNVHFRNIRGRFLDFQETFIDDGDVDMLRAMRVYKDVGYDGMMMPDHVPRIDGDVNEAQGFAFALGYIKALIAAA